MISYFHVRFSLSFSGIGEPPLSRHLISIGDAPFAGWRCTNVAGSPWYDTVWDGFFWGVFLERLEIELGVEGKRVFSLAWAGDTAVA